MALSKQNAAAQFKRSGPASRLRPPRQLLHDAGYEAIKNSIITCKFKLGECINDAGVSALPGFGRTSVNKALDRLMLEEMVEVIPRTCVIVKSVVLHEVLQVIDARLINEAHCAWLAAQRADNTPIEKLADIAGRARRQERCRHRTLVNPARVVVQILIAVASCAGSTRKHSCTAWRHRRRDQAVQSGQGRGRHATTPRGITHEHWPVVLTAAEIAGKLRVRPERCV